jgi:hypothetical protein
MVAGPADRVPDVLLVGPPLGHLPGQIQPGRHRCVAGPAHDGRLLQAHGVVVPPDLLAGPAQQAGHDARAQPARRLHPALVLRIERGDELAVVPAGVQQPGLITVPADGQLDEVPVEQVRRDVLHAPAAGLGRRRPLGVLERAEEREQVGMDLGDQRTDIPWRYLSESHQSPG